jgi:ubiquinone biosynthesis monooxygenase Coq7
MTEQKKQKAARWPELPLPGGPDMTARRLAMIRVDHAGELGAVRIYEGQLAVLGQSARTRESAAIIRAMAAQEERHLEKFDHLLRKSHARPTALRPLWDAAGFALGALSAFIGERAAMACTAAVEEVIDEHYARQSHALGEADPALKSVVDAFRKDEAHHRAEALAAGAEAAPGYRLFSAAIKAGCRLAIRLSARL